MSYTDGVQYIFQASFYGEWHSPKLTIPSPQTATISCAVNLFFGWVNELQIYCGKFLLMDTKHTKLFAIKQSKGCKFMPGMHQDTFGGRNRWLSLCSPPDPLAAIGGLILGEGSGESYNNRVVRCAVPVQKQHKAPQYVTDCCIHTSDIARRQHLRSAGCHQLFVPRHRRSMFGRRGLFCICSRPGGLELVTRLPARSVTFR